MLDLPTLQRNSVSFCRSAVVQNRQQIFEFASTGHSTPTYTERGCWLAGSQPGGFRAAVDRPGCDSTIEREHSSRAREVACLAPGSPAACSTKAHPGRRFAQTALARLEPLAEAALRVHIEDCHRFASVHQGHREVGGDRRFPGAALLLCDSDDLAGHANRLRPRIVAAQYEQRNW